MSTYINSDDQLEVLAAMPGDKNFKFATQFVEYPRAAIGVDQKCPTEYKDLIQQMQHKGWIYPIAYIPAKEYIWAELKR